MGLMSRFVSWFKSEAHSGLDELENKTKMLDQSLRDLKDMIDKVTSSTALAISNQKQIERKIEIKREEFLKNLKVDPINYLEICSKIEKDIIDLSPELFIRITDGSEITNEEIENINFKFDVGLFSKVKHNHRLSYYDKLYLTIQEMYNLVLVPSALIFSLEASLHIMLASG